MNNELQIKPEMKAILEVEQKKEVLISAFTAPNIIDEMYVFAPEYIQSWKPEKKEQFIRATIITISEDEKLKDCFKSSHGKLSIMKAVKKACSTGLEIGGKHAYLVPQNVNIGDSNNKNYVQEARFSIKASGYYALLCGGDRPIFKDLRWDIVREKDECKINSGNGEIDHNKFIGKDAGEILGGWVQAIKLNGQKEAKFYSEEKMNQWKNSSKTDSVWKEWFEEMGEQAMIRHFCDKYEQARDLLAAAIYEDDELNTETDTVNEAENALDNALNNDPKDFDDVFDTKKPEVEEEKEAQPDIF